MILRLVLENAPNPQNFEEILFEGGQLTIGRSDDADFQLDDPDMYVSRRHCILTEEGGVARVTDASSGGVFIDNAANPLGHGNSAPLEPGMRLRLGDFVFRVETGAEGAAAPAAATPQPAAQPGGFDFGTPEPEPEAPPRPSGLPDPFGLERDQASAKREVVRAPPRPLDQDDPFELDLQRAFSDSPRAAPEQPTRDHAPASPFGGTSSDSPFADRPPVNPDSPFAASAPPKADSPFSGETPRPFFGTDAPSPDADAPPLDSAPQDDPFADAFAGFDPGRRPGATAPPTPAPPPEDKAPPPLAPEPKAAPEPAPPAPQATADAQALREALYRGMGLDPARLPAPADPVAEMEEIGARMRDLVEGLTLLLRTRAQEKQKVRVAQTLISSSDVNPLKFVANTDEALTSLVAPRGQGYLAPQQAVHEAYRDLVDHQMRTWAALQSALRRMIDRFDPEALEREIADTGLMEKLIAGGRSAKLWQLYVERYTEIARAAEEQFLGEVGRDFRDAYEDKGRP